MNSDSYIECMVKRRTPGYLLFLKYLLIGLTVVAALASFLFGVYAFVVAVIFGVAAYFFGIHIDVEYEYLYLDKEITIDKVMHKEKRKRVATYELSKIEIMAPIKSYRLDGYKNRQVKTVDISSQVEAMPDKRYVFFYNGDQKVIFEPNEELTALLKKLEPWKVYTD